MTSCAPIFSRCMFPDIRIKPRTSSPVTASRIVHVSQVYKYPIMYVCDCCGHLRRRQFAGEGQDRYLEGTIETSLVIVIWKMLTVKPQGSSKRLVLSNHD